MSTPQDHWNRLYTIYTQSENENLLKSERLTKIDELVYTDNIENIRNGLTLMTTIAPEYLCRYLELDGESVVLREAGNFSSPLLAERVLVESVKGEAMWQGLFESGAFDSMHFRSLGDVSIDDLSESEKEFCVRMAKEMVLIPKGEFIMGALEDDSDAYDREKPRHKVTLTQNFLIGKYQVTQVLWESVMGSNPSRFNGANRPVEKVSWFDCVLFCNKLSELEGLEPVYGGLGDYQVDDDQNMDEDEIEELSTEITCNWNAKGYRLPTEAEWEYAARSGQQFKYAGSDNVDEVAWYGDNSGRETHPVGQKKPNGFGLYDMSGNVFEWVWDWYDDYSGQNGTDLVGVESGQNRVNRGGSWFGYARGTPVSYRNYNLPDYRYYYVGFRPGRTL